MDQIYEELIEKYEFDIDNTAIYYLFDRVRDVKKYINEHAKTISMNKICKANIIHAGVEMLKYLEQKKISP